MPTVNASLHDLAIAHQIDIHRLSTGTVNEVQSILDAVKDDILAAIARNDPTGGPAGYSKIRLQAMLAEIRKINASAYSDVGDFLNSHLLDAAQYEADFQAQAVTAATPAAITAAVPSGKAIADALGEPIQGRTVGQWLDALEATANDKMASSITIGAVRDEDLGALIARVKGKASLNFADGVFQQLARGTDSTARTLLNAAAAAGREAFYSENDDLIDKVQWISTLDTRTCLDCALLDGQTFAIDQGPRPPEHWNCRCTTAPVTKSWEALGIDAKDWPEGTRASMDGQVSEKITYPDWLDKQSAARQDDALGPTRGALYRQGGLAIDRFTDKTGRAYTLAELRKRDAEAFGKAGL